MMTWKQQIQRHIVRSAKLSHLESMRAFKTIDDNIAANP
jgi:hypothetical protein